MRAIIGIKLAFLFLVIASHVKAQNKYWISTNATQITSIQDILGEPLICSEWLHACSYELDSIALHRVAKSGISYQKVTQSRPLVSNDNDFTYGFALEQIEANVFTQQNLTGKGIKIGIIDGGFLKADSTPALQHLFNKGLVKSYKDYITPDLRNYGGSTTLDDNHGTDVWQFIGGYRADKGVLFGLATGASYYLARTDHGGYEKRIEEDALIRALEDMDQQGVKLVNISLGYNIGFTDPSENYKPTDMDGQTTMLAKAVEIAALKKGMLIVVAAGNEGSDDWGTLSTPGDAEHVLTVGASKFKVWDKMGYSSIGPEFTDFVKPDIVVYSPSGTSHSTPIVTGIAACMWEMDSMLTNLEIIKLLKQAGNFYPYPNNYLGYGVPTLSRVVALMEGQEILEAQKIQSTKNTITIKENFDAKYLVAFHKKDDKNVLARVIYHPLGNKVKIKRISGASRTSLLIGSKVYEIFWE